MEKVNYNKLRLDVLERLVCGRMIDCKDNRTDMIRQLRLDDEGKYIRESTVEKYGDDQYLIGIDLARHDLAVQMGKLLEKGKAKISHYSYGRRYYITNINILEDGVD